MFLVFFCKFTVLCAGFDLFLYFFLPFVLEYESSRLSKCPRSSQPCIPSYFAFVLFSPIFPLEKLRSHVFQYVTIHDIFLLSFVFLKQFHIFQLFISVCCPLGNFFFASLVAQTVKDSPAVRETWVQSLG